VEEILIKGLSGLLALMFSIAYIHETPSAVTRLSLVSWAVRLTLTVAAVQTTSWYPAANHLSYQLFVQTTTPFIPLPAPSANRSGSWDQSGRLTFDQSPRESLQLLPRLDQQTSRRYLDGDLLPAVSGPDVEAGVLITHESKRDGGDVSVSQDFDRWED
jgi:hypothetical protein